jgi:hypothetical protein
VLIPALYSAFPTRIILHRHIQEQKAAVSEEFGLRVDRERFRDSLAPQMLYPDRIREFRVKSSVSGLFSARAMLLTI